jgi:hypothetical protein
VTVVNKIIIKQDRPKMPACRAFLIFMKMILPFSGIVFCNRNNQPNNDIFLITRQNPIAHLSIFD